MSDPGVAFDEYVPPSRGLCHYCKLPVAYDDPKAHESNNTPGVWAHATCWYDGGPFERETQERQREQAQR